MQSLSRSTGLMFTFDLAVLFIVTYYFAGNFANNTMSVLTTILVTIFGLFSFYLKGQYKIREHNLTKWNLYRLFEGILFANIPAVLLLFFFVPKLVLFRFLILNICSIFICLALYRICFHYYLFNFKPVKNILIIGTNKNARLIADEIMAKKALKMKVVGFVKDTIVGQPKRELSDTKCEYFNFAFS